jgi:uncharacterized CHY-type Zn-finger protein
MFDHYSRKEGSNNVIVCEFCKKVFLQDYYYHHALTRHPKQVQEFWIKCPDCNSKFPDNVMLQRHIKLLHKKEAKLEMAGNKCQFCKKLFKSSGKLDDHTRKMHQDAIKHCWIPCPNCKKYFPTTKAMKGTVCQYFSKNHHFSKKTIK